MTSGDEANRGDLRCPDCHGLAFSEVMANLSFPYGTDGVVLTYRAPIVTCLNCDFEFTDDRGEWARHCAARDYKLEQKNRRERV